MSASEITFAERSPYKRFKIIAADRLNPATIVLTLDASIEVMPGQFAMLWLPGVGEKPFCLCNRDPLQVMIVDVGPFSHLAQGLGVGNAVWLRAPLGRGFLLHRKTAVMVAGGYGIAPLAFLAGNAIRDGMDIELFLGAKTSADLLFVDHLVEMGAKVTIATEDGSAGEECLVTDLVERRLQLEPADGVYACGPHGMLEELEKISKKHRIPYQLSWEAHMRCGIGLCGSCELEREGKGSGWLVCMDGPVQRVEN